MCNHEKARRIVESEDPAVMDDPERLRITDHWVRVQAQMVVDKFMGKKVGELGRLGHVIYVIMRY